MCEPSDRRPRLAVLANWREYDAPLHLKLWVAARNTWTKVRMRSDCCGRGGEPGC